MFVCFIHEWRTELESRSDGAKDLRCPAAAKYIHCVPNHNLETGMRDNVCVSVMDCSIVCVHDCIS